MFDVKLPVAINFLSPPFCACFRQRKILAPFMAMPKAAVNKNNRPELWENKVWLPQQCLIVQFIPEPFGE